MSATAELARELTALVLATVGVQEVYPAGPGLEALVRVSRSGGSGRVLATICVLDEHPVPATLRLVSRALAERLTAEPEEFEVTVKASRIQ